MYEIDEFKEVPMDNDKRRDEILETIKRAKESARHQ